MKSPFTLTRQIGFLILAAIFVLLTACASEKSTGKAPERSDEGFKEIRKGAGWYQKGCYDRALEHFLRANEIFTSRDRLDGVATSINNIGNVYRVMGDSAGAVQFFEDAFRIYEHLSDCDGMVRTLSGRAAALIDEGRLALAERALEHARALQAECGIDVLTVTTHTGILLTRRNQYDRAEQVLKKGLKKTDPSRHGEYATVNVAMANLMLATGRPEPAIDFLKAALEADRKSGFHRGIADDLVLLGSTYARTGRHDVALDFLKRGIKIHALLGDRKKVESVFENLKKSASKTGDDLSVTTYFIDKWLAGEAFEPPCR